MPFCPTSSDWRNVLLTYPVTCHARGQKLRRVGSTGSLKKTLRSTTWNVTHTLCQCRIRPLCRSRLRGANDMMPTGQELYSQAPHRSSEDQSRLGHAFTSQGCCPGFGKVLSWYVRTLRFCNFTSQLLMQLCRCLHLRTIFRFKVVAGALLRSGVLSGDPCSAPSKSTIV